MTAITKAWVNIADAAVDPDSPLDAALMTGLRDIGVHLREWVGASYYAGAVQNHNHDGLNSANVALADASVTNAKLIGPATGFMVRADVAGLNGSPVSLLQTDTVVATVDLGSVVAGDRILVTGFFEYSGGGGTNKIHCKIGKNSGTATTLALSSSSAIYGSSTTGVAGDCHASGIIKVTGSGTLVLALTGKDTNSSVGANIATNFGQLHAMVIKGG